MDIEIEKPRRKTKLVGVRLYKEEYELISSVARQKGVSRSFVAESLVRSAIANLRTSAKEAKRLAQKRRNSELHA